MGRPPTPSTTHARIRADKLRLGQQRFENVFFEEFQKATRFALHDVFDRLLFESGPPGLSPALVHAINLVVFHGWSRLSMDNAFHSSIIFASSEVTGSTNECTHPWMGLASMEFIHPHNGPGRQGWEAETLLIVLAKLITSGRFASQKNIHRGCLQRGTPCSR